MKLSILLRLTFLFCLSIPTLGQGRFFLANDWRDLHVPILLLDPGTDEAFGLYGPEWRVEARGGARNTPAEQLKPLKTNQFQPFFRGGYFTPSPVSVAEVAAGAEATVQLLVFHRDRPEVKVPIGTYVVKLAGLNELGSTLPVGDTAITNVAPKELVDLLPRRPIIEGEPTYKGKRLSYWFQDLLPGNLMMNARARPNGMFEFRPRIVPQLGPGGAPVMNPGPVDEQDWAAALRSAGAAAVPVLLQYSASDPMMTGMIVRRVYFELRRLGLEAEVERVAFASLTNTNSVVRRNALDLLRCPSIQSETPRLMEFVRTGAPEVRKAALEALNRCRVIAPALLPLYRDCLESGESSPQTTILRSLTFFGPAAKSLLPVIEPFLEKDNPMLRVSAAGALWAIDSRTNVLPVLIRELEHASFHMVVMDSFRVLGEMGPAAKEAVPVIIKTVERLNQDPRFGGPSFLPRQAAETLKKIEPGSEEKLPPDPMLRFRGLRPEGIPGFRPRVRPGLPEMPLGCAQDPTDLASMDC